MDLLFYIKPSCFEDKVDTDTWVEQNSPAMLDAEEGDSVWVFTRTPETGRYALVCELVVARGGPSPDRIFGRYRVWSSPEETRVFEVQNQPNLESLLRDLSISTDARILAHAFQGHSGVRRISPEDSQRMARWADGLAQR